MSSFRNLYFEWYLEAYLRKHFPYLFKEIEAQQVKILPCVFGGSGQKTVTTAGVAERLVANPTYCESVTIKALHGNTGYVYIGDGEVSSAVGFVLDAGEPTSMDIDDLHDIFLDVSVNGEGVSYLYVR